MVSPAPVSEALRLQLLHLYRAHLRTANHFAAYNFRHYFTRWTRDQFRAFKLGKPVAEGAASVEEPTVFAARMQHELAARRRQALVNSMFQVDRIVVENARV
ncbi:LYR motif containing 4 [Thamnocephalis sphaerospora]|uniref:LYR motif containing 4 n=1 Tax=Thamnocephalis sphaerospora TaxID=78915 RepID=A0A4V1IWG5_9FUNG|nr:LYR motif containing 4 [Thamnocephalis sphaerospora]|eukprot:RKP07479.1 LYR motif containing 4 [Thamnocephalis sphaerospora]